uniref:Uncharacterized protein n=1 Tax=Thermogemmatispora argillosa TaxID=2045280 RepID=A0A455T7B6_9CHLR|nr:hypothetical protein KTA_27330 [Thermogemmatispora argillosa]
MQEPQQASDREALQGSSPAPGPEQMAPVQAAAAGGGQGQPAMPPASQPQFFQPATPGHQGDLVLRTSLLMALAFFIIMALLNACTLTPLGDALGRLSVNMASGMLGYDSVTLANYLYSLIFSLVQALLAACVYLGAGLLLGRRTANMGVVMRAAGLATLWYVLLDVLFPFLFTVIFFQIRSIPLYELNSYFSSSDFIRQYIIFTIFDTVMIGIFGLGAAALGGELTLPRLPPVRLDPYLMQGPYPVQMPYPMPGGQPAGGSGTPPYPGPGTPPGARPNQEPPTTA